MHVRVPDKHHDVPSASLDLRSLGSIQDLRAPGKNPINICTSHMKRLGA